MGVSLDSQLFHKSLSSHPPPNIPVPQGILITEVLWVLMHALPDCLWACGSTFPYLIETWEPISGASPAILTFSVAP